MQKTTAFVAGAVGVIVVYELVFRATFKSAIVRLNPGWRST